MSSQPYNQYEAQPNQYQGQPYAPQGVYGAGYDPNSQYSPVVYEEAGYKEEFLSDLSPFNVRIGFIRKVYMILFAQLGITTLLSFFSMQVPAIGNFVLATFPVLIWVAIVLSFVIVILLACIPPLARSVPINYILLLVFTLCISYEIAGVCAAYEAEGMAMEVYLAAGATAAITGGLTVPFNFQLIIPKRKFHLIKCLLVSIESSVECLYKSHCL